MSHILFVEFVRILFIDLNQSIILPKYNIQYDLNV